MHVLPISLLLAAVVFVLAGCQSAPPRVSQTGSPGEVWVEGHFSNGLEIDGVFNPDGTLDRSPFLGHFFPGTRIMLTNLASVTSPNGHPQVQASVQNTGRDRQRLQYRFLWYNANDMEVGASSGSWSSETLEPREPRTLEGVGGSTDITRFKLLIRAYKPQK